MNKKGPAGNKGVNRANIRNVKNNECSADKGIIRGEGETICPNFNIFLKILTEGAVAPEAGSLMQYFTTLTEKANNPLPGMVLTLEHL